MFSFVVVVGLIVLWIKVFVGIQSLVQYGIGVIDFGIFVWMFDGWMFFMFGDIWVDGVGGMNWCLFVVLYFLMMNFVVGVMFNGCVGVGGNMQGIVLQFWYYLYDVYFMMVIFLDVIMIGMWMYLYVIVNGLQFGVVCWIELWKFDDNGVIWQYIGLQFFVDMVGGKFQCIIWGEGNDGYVYIYGIGFQCDKGIVFYWVLLNNMMIFLVYQLWGFVNGLWGWGKFVIEVFFGQFGEMCLCLFGGRWIFIWFNLGVYWIDVMVLNILIDNLYIVMKIMLLYGIEWNMEDVLYVVQFYGGYIIFGFILLDLYFSVSQWNMGNNSVYYLEQFWVQGLV